MTREVEHIQEKRVVYSRNRELCTHYIYMKRNYLLVKLSLERTAAA